MTMTLREAFDKGTETFNAHDIDGFTEVLADDVVFRAPGGMAGQGKAACADFYRGWLNACPDAHVEGTFTGTHNGVLRSPSADIPPTGRSVAIDYIHVLRFRDGKHVSFDLMFDRLTLLEQLGLVPAPAPAA